MSHRRTEIRAAIVTALEGLDVFETVTRSRVHNFQAARELPAAAVYGMFERSPRDAVAPKLKRTVTVFVDLHLQAGATLDDEADALCLQVEGALGASLTLGGLCLDSQLVKTSIGLTGEGERRTGLARLEYEFTYRTLANGTPA